MKILNIENNGEIIHLLVTEEEFTRANEDVLFVQELFRRHSERYSVTDRVCNESFCDMENFTPSTNNNTENMENVQTVGENANNMESLWSEAETLLLISLYDNHKEDFKHAKKRKHVWTLIAEEMIAHGYLREPDKLERKWTNLMRVYRAIKDNKGPRKTGRGAQNYKYFDKLEEIVGDKPSNNPSSSTVLDVGVNASVVPACDEDISTESTENNVECAIDVDADSENICPNPKRRKENQSISLKKQKMLQKESRHKELVELEQKRLAVEEKKIQLLEKYLEKLSEKRD